MGSQDNSRIVLPQTSCPSRRRVIAPTGSSRAKTALSAKAANSQVQTTVNTATSRPQSKPQTMSAKEYKEYLEDMELKIRYMKNDIEFKQSQMRVKTSAPQISTLKSQPLSIRQSKYSGVCKKLPLSSTLIAASKPKVLPSFSHGGNRGVFIAESNATNNFIYVKKPCATTNNTYTAIVVKPEASFRSQRVITSSVQSCPAGQSVVSQTSHCDSQGPIVSFPKGSAQMHYLAQTSASKSSCATFVSNTTNAHGVTVPTTTSASRKQGDYTISKPIYVSPSKNQAIWSHSRSQTVVPSSWTERQAQLSSALTCSTGKEKKIEYNVVTNDAATGKSTSLIHTPSPKACKANITTPKLKISGKKVSKYKMMRLSPNSVSKLCPQLFTGQPQLCQPSGCQISNIHKFDRRKSIESTPGKANMKRVTPKLEILMAAKLVSKYKLKRLSPTCAPKMAPRLSDQNALLLKSSNFHSSVYSLGQNFNKHKLDRRQKHVGNLDMKSSGISGASTPLKSSKADQHRGRQQIANPPIRRSTAFPENMRNKKSFNTQLRTQQFTYIKNKHKLDRRTNKSPLTRAALQLPGRVIGRRSNSKHHFVNNLVSPSISASKSTLHVKKQALKSKYTWRRLSTNGVNSHMPSNVQLKWSTQRQWMTPSRKHWMSMGSLRPTAIKRSNLVMIRGVVYRSMLTWTSPIKAAPHATRASSQNMSKLITLRGVHFHADCRGKKLCRTGLGISGQDGESTSANAVVSRKGQMKPVNETAIIAASRAVQRSLAVAAAKYRKNNTKWKRNKQHCIFFGRFGKCHRGDKCHYVHDPAKVAVCTRFLRGKCDKANCPFSHNASVHKMPVCLHYLQGLCLRNGCPYLHVRVNADAPVCKDFRNGYCSLGDKCQKLHSLVCPSFALTGECSRGEVCSLLHRRIKRETPKTLKNLRASSLRKRKKSSSGETPRAKKERTQAAGSTSGTLNCPPSKTYKNKVPTETTGADPVNILVLPVSEAPSSSAHSEVINLQSASDELSDSKPLQPSVTATVVASQSRVSAPLVAQPSFISLHTDPPQVPTPQHSVPVSTDGSVDRSNTELFSIKPQFLAQRLSNLEQPPLRKTKSLEHKDSHSGALGSSLETEGTAKEIKPAPRPAFLLNLAAKTNMKKN